MTAMGNNWVSMSLFPFFFICKSLPILYFLNGKIVLTKRENDYDIKEILTFTVDSRVELTVPEHKADLLCQKKNRIHAAIGHRSQKW